MAAVQAIAQFFWGILLTLDSIVYFLISWLYQIILLLCRIDILGNGTEISELVGRVYTIIGVVILFLVAYSLLRAMVNPDDLKGKKSPTNIVKNVLISIALIALTPTIFSFALDFQNALLEQNTIGKLVLGDRTDGESSATTIEKGGNRMAATVLQSFLHPNYSQCTIVTSDDGSVGYDCPEIATGGLNFLLFEVANEHTTYDAVWDEVENNGNFLNITTFAYALAHESTMTYYPIISTIAGAFVFLVLLSYCIDIAVRTIKLAVFELIAPLPILARIMPGEQGEKVFSNWVKACISTYVEVFIRLAILFFAVLIIKIVIQNIPTIFLDLGLLNGEVGILVFLFTQAFLVIGIILFVKQAPQILKDITGLDSGKYGKSLMKGFGMMTASLGGGATAAIRSFAHDKGEPHRVRRAFTAGLGGAGRGIWQGRKTEKFGDIPKAAGRAASNTLSHRGNLDSYEGNWAGKRFQYYKQKFSDTAARAKDWAGGSNEELKKLQEVNNNILQVIKGIKDVAEDYIDKHSYEFFADIHDFSDDDQKNIQKLNAQESYYKTRLKNAQDYGNEDDIEAAEVELDRIKKARDSIKGKYRLDILRAKSEDMSISAEERALWRNLYNKSRKVNVDNFATSVKEDPELAKNAQLEAEKVGRLVTTLGEIIKENRGVPSVQYAIGSEVRDGVKAGFTEADLVSNTAEFVKNFKKAAEFSNNDIQGKLDEISRRDARRNNNSKDSGGGSH